MNKLFDITNKVVFITGAAGGLGAQMLEGYAESGCKLAFCDLRQEAVDERVKILKEAYPNIEVLGLQCNVTKEEEVKNTVEKIIAKYGKIDILVNNAGIALVGTVDTYKYEDWRKLMDVNVDAIYLVSKYVIPGMKEQKWGRIINLASIEAITGTKSDRASRHAYNTSKGAVRGLTVAMACTYAKYNICVNCIGPGFFDTNMTKELMAHPSFQTMYNMWCPMGRLGRPGELNGTVLYLSSEACDYVTGQYIVIDGGYTLV